MGNPVFGVRWCPEQEQILRFAQDDKLIVRFLFLRRGLEERLAEEFEGLLGGPPADAVAVAHQVELGDGGGGWGR